MVFTLPEVCTRNSFARVARSLVTTSRVWAGFSEPLLITRTILGLLHLRREFMVMRISVTCEIGSRRRLNGMPAHLATRSGHVVRHSTLCSLRSNTEIGAGYL